MNRLTVKFPETVVIGGAEYHFNTGYRNALMTWDAFEAAHCGELTEMEAAEVSVLNMFTEPRPPICDEAVSAIASYLEVRTGTGGKREKHAPMIDLEQDSQLIYDAFQLAGYDLDGVNMSFAQFMSVFRELPDRAQLCRVIYLRQQWRDGKLTKEERKECDRRGWDVIRIHNKRAEQDQDNYEDEVLRRQNELRAKRGLPPV